MPRPKVVIVGAGFGGLYAAKTLKRTEVDILIVDQHNYHTFQPLLYQVATAGLDTGDVAHQVRGVFHRQRNVRFRQGTVVGVDWDAKAVLLKDGSRLRYDYLILAAGAVYNDLGTPGVRRYGLFLKSLSEAANIRSHILRQFERVSADPSLLAQGALNFVIVGAGPTGVEMAGALVELFDRVIPKDFPELGSERAKVMVLELQETVLPPYSEKTRRYTEAVLRKRGVEVRLNTAVAEVREREVVLEGGETIPTETLIWAAGIRGHPLVRNLGLELTRGERIAVDKDLRVAGHEGVFVVGDLSGAQDDEGKLYPQVAPVAIQQGQHAGKQIARLLRGESTKAFRYFDKGSMAIIGRSAGVAELSKTFLGLKLRGFLGWLAWLFIHLIYLPGYRNRFSALLSWTYNYFTYDRHTRLIAYMQPSPGEIANRTDKLLAPESPEDAREASKALDVTP
jgi:NADH dehydrogenase